MQWRSLSNTYNSHYQIAQELEGTSGIVMVSLQAIEEAGRIATAARP